MEGWEEEIDIDDLDLPSIFHSLPSLPSIKSKPTLPPSLPSLQPCSQLSRSSQSLPLNSPSDQQPSSLAPERVEDAPPRTTAPRRLIPGPAGSVQASMHRQAAAAIMHPRSNSHLEQEMGDQRADGGEGDGDFMLNPWLCALDFLGVEGGSALPSRISSIKTHQRSGRVPQVVGIVKSCAPNGLGDQFVTLKDPTGTIGASIHRKVITESNFGGDLSVGCVLVLKQVVVFSPVRSTSYLNVTLNNVVKLFSKDCEPPHRRNSPTFTSCGASGKHIEVGLSEAESFVRQGAERGAGAESEREHIAVGLGPTERAPLATQGAERVAGAESQREHIAVGLGAAMRPPLARQGTERVAGAEFQQQHIAVEFGAAERAFLARQGAERLIDAESNREHLIVGLVGAESQRKGLVVGLGAAERKTLALQEAERIAGEQVIKNANRKRIMTDDKIAGGQAHSLPYAISGTPATTFGVAEPDVEMSEPKMLISKVSVGQWTDEQLSELFSDYQDDVFM